ncbi:MAG: exodeoxyribonuclease VII large subunit, partial [Burkholderiaceae bacterium]|nr:exodeoxyribonuclease VII large subunit [Burkholderiaceae bacterium]
QHQDLLRRIHGAARQALGAAAERVQGAQAHLLHLNPERVLERGYSITETADGAIVRDSAQLSPEQELKITLARGSAAVRVRRSG